MYHYIFFSHSYYSYAALCYTILRKTNLLLYNVNTMNGLLVERKRAKERNLCNKKIEAEKKQKFFIILCSDKRLQKQR